MSENSVPFLTQAALLDQYIHSENLGDDPEIINLLVNILRAKENLRDYFFRSGPSYAWAKIFWENDFLSIPPEPTTTKDGYSLPPWDVQYFLIIVAPQVPEIVVNHVNVLSGHAWYRARAIEALSKIPVEYSEKAVPTVIKWISDPQVAEITQTEVLSLIGVMIRNGKTAIALNLFDLLAAPRDERKSHNAKSSYSELFGYREFGNPNVFDLLKDTCTLELIQILEHHLVKSLYSVDTGEQKISWWRNAIEETGQDHLNDYQDFVLSALRDTLIYLTVNHLEQSLQIITKYLKSKYTILRRLALYLIGRYPTFFRAEVVNELLNSSNMDDVKIHHEFFLLLENCFSLLSETDQHLIIETILDGPDLERIEKIYEKHRKSEYPDRDKYISNWKNAWIRDRLWMISSHLDEKSKSILDKLVKIGGEPDHPAFLAWTSRAFSVAEVSPYSEAELGRLMPNQLLDVVKSWRPQSNDDFGPKRISYEGFGKELARLICLDTGRYRKVLPQICLVQPEYTVAIFGLWANPEFDEPIPWEIVLELCEKLLSKKLIWNDDPLQGRYRETWRNARFSIVHLLQVSVNNEEKRVSGKLLEKVAFVLVMLLSDTDPTPDADQPQDGWFGHNDPITIAINRVRPVALKSFLLCQVRIAVRDGADESKPREDYSLSQSVSKLLDEKLNPKIEPSRAVRSVFGQFVPTLYWLDPLWLKNRLDTIFPVEDYDESKWLFMSAWDAYVLNSYGEDVFEIMRSKYALAIEYLSQGYKTESNLGQASNLSAHLLLNYLFSDLPLENFIASRSLLLDFFQKNQPEIRRQAAWALWRILESNPDDISNFWPKAKELWMWRSKEATISNHSPDFNAEMVEFAQLLQVAPDSENMKSMQYLLDGLLPHLRQAELYDIGWTSVEMFLASRVDKEPVRVIKFYRSMCEQKFTPPQWPYFSEHSKKIVTVAAENTQSRVDALALIDFFAQWWRDFNTFKPIYQKFAG